MQGIETMPIGELAVERPSRARVFERFGLDYCCGGDQTLADACRQAGIDLGEVSDALACAHADDRASATEEDTWTQLDLGELADHIVDVHHSYLHAELPRISALAQKVADAHGERHPEMRNVATTYAALRAELEMHMEKEEQMLFPLCRELGASETFPSFHCGSVANPIRVMHSEHDAAGAALERIRKLTNDFTAPADACPTWHALVDALDEFEGDLHTHIHKENNALFPRAVAREAVLANEAF